MSIPERISSALKTSQLSLAEQGNLREMVLSMPPIDEDEFMRFYEALSRAMFRNDFPATLRSPLPNDIGFKRFTDAVRTSRGSYHINPATDTGKVPRIGTDTDLIKAAELVFKRAQALNRIQNLRKNGSTSNLPPTQELDSTRMRKRGRVAPSVAFNERQMELYERQVELLAEHTDLLRDQNRLTAEGNELLRQRISLLKRSQSDQGSNESLHEPISTQEGEPIAALQPVQTVVQQAPQPVQTVIQQAPQPAARPQPTRTAARTFRSPSTESELLSCQVSI